MFQNILACSGPLFLTAVTFHHSLMTAVTAHHSLMSAGSSALSSNLPFSFLSQDITPPPTPSPVKAAGKKRAMAASVSDDEDGFVPRYIVLIYV